MENVPRRSKVPKKWLVDAKFCVDFKNAVKNILGIRNSVPRAFALILGSPVKTVKVVKVCEDFGSAGLYSCVSFL